jgi:hypothetical protein
MEILKNNTKVKFIYTAWFSQVDYANSGTIEGYCERNKTYQILTKHGYCRLNSRDFVVLTNL